MNKSEMIALLSEQTLLPQEQAFSVVNGFFDSIKSALLNGSRVEIRGFGSFSVKSYDGYTGRNPKTGVSVAVKPKKLPFFRTGKELKEFIND